MSAALDLVRELEERDSNLAATSRELVETQKTAERVGGRTEEVAQVLARLPAERAASDEEVAAARMRLAARRKELDETQEASEGDEASRRRLAEAEWALRRAEDHLEQVERARSALEQQAEGAAESLVRLEAEAGDATSYLNALPAVEARELAPPSPGIDGLLDWAPRARAAAFVARTGVDRQRDALIREAEETAASVLGESFAGSSVAVVRQRLERPGGESS